MAAHTLPISLDRAYRTGFFAVNDPGDDGEISWSNKGHVIVSVVTAGAEDRELPPAGNYGVGTRVTVVGKTLAGAVTIEGGETDVVLNDAGDVAEFIVSQSGSSKVWRLVSYSGANFAADSFPVAAGTLEVTTGDQDTSDAIAALFNALKDAGLVTGTVTAATET